MSAEQSIPRHYYPWMDALRVTAAFMVIAVHGASPYFFGSSDPQVHFWSDLYGSLVRSCVPLFFMISGALLLPVKESMEEFYRKRLPRVAFPLVLWALVFTLVGLDYSQPLGSLLKGLNPLNFPQAGLHLWYLFSLVGLYLFLPILSPWYSTSTLKQKLIFLGLWGVTLLFPYFRVLSPEILGEAFWNSFGLLAPFAGYLGYMVLGRLVLDQQEKLRRLPLWVLGAVFLGSWGAMVAAQEFFFTRNGGNQFALWDFSSLGVALQAGSLFLLFQRISLKSPFFKGFWRKLGLSSFGIYLIHYPIVYALIPLWDSTGIPAVFLIPLNVVVTFLLSFLGVQIIERLPFKKYLLG